MTFSRRSCAERKELEKSPWLTWTKVRRVAEGLFAFGIVAAIMTVLLIGIGIAGKNVGPNTAQLNTESPATSGSQNP
jgi:hypothetical protein